MRHLYVICFVLIWFSCTDSDYDCSKEEFNLIGSWQLVEFCFSPGDASCPTRIPDEVEIIELRSDSTYNYSIGSQSTVGTYSVIQNRIMFINSNENQDLGDRFINPINSCKLELNPFCFEECRALFEKVN